MSMSRGVKMCVVCMIVIVGGCGLHAIGGPLPPPAPGVTVTSSSTVPAQGPTVVEATSKSPQDASNVNSGFTLRQQELINQQNEYFQSELANFNGFCETSITAHIDWESFRTEMERHLDGQARRSFYGYCSEFFGTVGVMCRDNSATKSRVQSQISSYVCSYGGPGRRALSIQNGTAAMWIDWDAPNTYAFIQDQVGRQL